MYIKTISKKLIDFIVLQDCPKLQLGEVTFQNLTIRKLLLEKGNYDINRLFWFPEKDITYIRSFDEQYVSDINLTRKVLTVDGLGNPEEQINRVSIQRTIKLIKRNYYLLDQNWVLFFKRRSFIKFHYFLVNDWRKRHSKILGYLFLKLNNDVITNILPFLAEWDTIVEWTIDQLVDTIECPWLILPDDIRSIPQIIKLVNNSNKLPISQNQLAMTMSIYHKSKTSL